MANEKPQVYKNTNREWWAFKILNNELVVNGQLVFHTTQ